MTLSAAPSSAAASLAMADSINLRLFLTCSMTDASSATTARYILSRSPARTGMPPPFMFCMAMLLPPAFRGHSATCGLSLRPVQIRDHRSGAVKLRSAGCASFSSGGGRRHMSDKTGSRGEIFVVDDDPAVRDTLSMVLSAGGYEVICFADGAALLSVARTRTPSCILLDVHIPGKSGLDILKELHGEDYPAPIFMISGQRDISMAVSAIKNGALDFIEKPFRGSEIVARLDEAIEAYARRQAENAPSRIATMHFPGREPLTRREREVLEQFTAGASNKEAGRHLGISPRTIEDHRANIMKKLGARNAADLVRIVMTAQQR